MPISLKTNLLALSTVRRLGEAGDALSSSFERLSSGSRINGAADDPAGLAVSSKLSLHSRVYAQGIRNGNDAVSMVNIAQGAVGELTNILFRLDELASQSANGTLSLAQRRVLDKEAHALTDEYNRIIESTQFNKLSLFSPELGRLFGQLGFGSNGLIEVSTGQGLGYTAGTGAFGAEAGSPGGTGNIATIDANGDGFLDYVYTSNGGANVTIALNNGAGGFEEVETLAALTTTSTALDVGDFDDDGLMDIAVGLSDGRIQIFRQSEPGVFESGAIIDLGPLTSPVTHLELGDLNGDGNLDIVLTGGGSLFRFLGDGNLGFDAAQFIGSGSTAAHSFDLGDLNGDGRLDFVTSLGPNNELTRYHGNGDGTFVAALTTLIGANKNSIIKVADLNHDGMADIVTGAGGIIGIYLSTGNGSTYAARVDHAIAGIAISEIDALDLNGDGEKELIIGGGSNYTIGTAAGDGTYTFATAAATEAGSNRFTLGDFNGDGVTDMIHQGTTGATVHFGETQTIATIGRLDLLSAANARESLTRIRTFRELAARENGMLGSALSRLKHGLSNLDAVVSNYDIAASRIRDADIAEETAKTVRLKILSESTAALAAQANQQSEIALTLLGI